LYGQAIVFQYQGRDADAIQLLEKALRIPLKDPDDALRKEKCEVLLKELK
jgi:hypothetical protein